MKRCRKEIPSYDILNQAGADIFGEIGQDALHKKLDKETKKSTTVGQEIMRQLWNKF